MGNWSYIRKNLKSRAKQALQENMSLCMKATLALVLTQLIVNWLAGNLSSPLEITLDQMRPLHSIAAAFRSVLPISLAASLLLELAVVFLTSPLDAGISGLYLEIVRSTIKENTQMGIRRVFDWYLTADRYGKTFLLALLIRLLTTFWMTLFCVGPLAAIYYHEAALTPAMEQAPPLSYMTQLLGLTILLALGIMLASLRVFSYMPAFYLLAQDPQIGVFRAIRQSKKLMRGHLTEYMVLELSFIPWYLSAVFTFGLSLLYLIPYRNACRAVFVRKRQFDLHAAQETDSLGEGIRD